LLAATRLEPGAATEAVEAAEAAEAAEAPLKTETGVEAELVVTDLSDIYISFWFKVFKYLLTIII